MTKKRLIELAVKMVVAALTAFLTALTTTSCMGHGPVASPDNKFLTGTILNVDGGYNCR